MPTTRPVRVEHRSAGGPSAHLRPQRVDLAHDAGARRRCRRPGRVSTPRTRAPPTHSPSSPGKPASAAGSPVASWRALAAAAGPRARGTSSTATSRSGSKATTRASRSRPVPRTLTVHAVGARDDVGVGGDPPGDDAPSRCRPAPGRRRRTRRARGRPSRAPARRRGSLGERARRVPRPARSARGRAPRTPAGSTPRSRAAVTSSTRPLGRRRHELVDGRHDRRAGDELAGTGRAADAHRPGDDPQHEHGRATSTATRPRPESTRPGTRRGHRRRGPDGRARSISPWPEGGGGQHDGDEGERRPTGVAG